MIPPIAAVILTCFSLADDTTVVDLTADKFPGSIFSRYHDGTLRFRLLSSARGLRLPVSVIQSRAVVPGNRLPWDDEMGHKDCCDTRKQSQITCFSSTARTLYNMPMCSLWWRFSWQHDADDAGKETEPKQHVYGPLNQNKELKDTKMLTGAEGCCMQSLVRILTGLEAMFANRKILVEN